MAMDLIVPIGGLVVLWLANMSDRNAMAGRKKLSVEYASLVYSFTILFFLWKFADGMGLMVSRFESHGFVIRTITPEDFSLEEVWSAGLSSPARFAFVLIPVMGVFVLLPVARRLIARWIPIDPKRLVHAVVLSASMIVIWHFVKLMFFHQEFLISVTYISLPEIGFLKVGLKFVVLLLLPFIGVGWLSRRSFKTCLRRLKIVVPTAKQILIALGVGVGTRIIFKSVHVIAASLDLWHFTIANESYIAIFLSGGIVACLSEETLFRGGVQPRLGLWLTAALFAMMHARGFSYDTTIAFLYGMILGVLYIRYNTSTAMVAHATANITNGLIMKILFYTRPF
ncbi:MAG TPA: CPBP family intramembrane glutamic endopeptidase [Bacillales bacterium]|nr:CPBP family intramembrane glutamic endopeptidase [Bacillales bacterium]